MGYIAVRTRLGVAGILVAALGMTGAEVSAQAPFAKLTEVLESGVGFQRVFFGTVVAKETVDLAFQVGGQVTEFPVDEGVTVTEGGLVARLDQEPFDLAFEEASAQAAQAQRTVARYEQLAGGAVSETTLRDSQTQLELARIGERNAERALEQATLFAPFDALVATRLVAKFATVGAGTPVVRLHDMSELRIEIDVPEALFVRVDQAQVVEIYAEFPASEKRYPVELREFNAETSPISQTYTITLGLEPPEGVTALPGSSARVTAVLQTDQPRIEVPASAVVFGNDGATNVMVFEPAGADEGTVSLTPVEVSATEHGAVAITSGLSAGQEIVAVGGSGLADGDTVRRFAGFGN